MKKTNDRKKQIIWAIFIAVIMISSVLGFSLRGDTQETSNKKIYNGHDFYKNEEGKWISYIENNYYSFDYLPDELNNITFESFNFNSSKTYIAYIPNEKNANFNYAISKVYSVLKNKGIYAVLACSKEENCPDIPLVDCNSQYQVISFVKSEINKIYKEDNCLVLECTNDDISKCADKLNYALLGLK